MPSRSQQFSAGGWTVQIPLLPGSAGRTYDVSPDGQRFLMIADVKSDERDSGLKVILVDNWFEELKRLVQTG